MKRLIALLVVLSLSVCLVACGASRTAQTADGFSEIMKNAGFEIYDAVETEATFEWATNVLFALGDNYQIEFYETESAETAQSAFRELKKTLDSEHNTRTLALSKTLNDYNYYAFNSGEEFFLIAGIDNTLIACTSDKQYRSEILDLVDELGYK